jgi:hypothetical protein
MACVGYRAWAWKRLLVKRIFFDALTKVVTRSSVLLSLLQNPVDTDDRNAQKKQNNHIRAYERWRTYGGIRVGGNTFNFLF